MQERRPNSTNSANVLCDNVDNEDGKLYSNIGYRVDSLDKRKTMKISR